MIQPLNYNWKFVDSFKEEYIEHFPENSKTIDIPHTVKIMPLNNFNEKDYQMVSTYKLNFDIDSPIDGQAVLLRFEGVMAKAHIYLNGQDLGEHVSTYLPFVVDISNYATQKDNNLIVVVDSNEDPNIPPFGYVIDYLTFGGIYREVYVEVHPKVYFQNIYVDGDTKGNMRIRADIANEHNDETKVEYVILEKGVVVGFSDSEECKIANPRLWKINDPYLYELRAIVHSKYGQDVKTVRFGFRTCKFTKEGFFLNNEKIKLIGLNRHQSFPYIGYAAPKALQYFDAEYLKNKCGVNIVRCSHYPASQHFLDRCDEIGLLVFDEIPGWQYISKEKAWRDNFQSFVEGMVRRNYNHPSVVIDGVRIDESADDHELYSKANDFVHSFDKTRCTGGVRNFKKSELLEDVYTYNDFICNGGEIGLLNPKTVTPDRNKPYMITEFNGHMYPTKSFDNEEMRLSQVFRHLRVLDDAFKYPEIAGAIGWCAFDYNTHKDFGSGDRICYHGVADIFRNPKYAMSVYASQQDAFHMMEICSSMSIGEHPASLLGDTVVLTNCDYVEFYKNDILIGKFYPETDKYPFLPHAPIIINDYIGSEIEKNERFKKADAKILKACLQKAAKVGFEHVGLFTLLKVGILMLKYHIDYQELTRFWNVYVSNWGKSQMVYTFKGIKQGKVMETKSIGPSTKFHLDVSNYKRELTNSDTYDATFISVLLLDEFNNLAQYSNEAVKIETFGPIEVLGPSIVPLIGGSVGITVRSVNQKGLAALRFVSTNYGTKEINFVVK